MTKHSVVFDRFAVSTSGYSLNDILLSVIQPKLSRILLRFRLHSVALTGEISSDSYFQCILWRDLIQ